jgi:hypothetical protein
VICSQAKFYIGSKLDGTAQVFLLQVDIAVSKSQSLSCSCLCMKTILQDGKPTSVTAESVFKGKRSVVFGVPGAFTPTCRFTYLGLVLNKQYRRPSSRFCATVPSTFLVSSASRTRSPLLGRTPSSALGEELTRSPLRT